MKTTFLVGIIGFCLTVNALAADQVVKEETTPPPPETAITPNQLPPIVTSKSQSPSMNSTSSQNAVAP